MSRLIGILALYVLMFPAWLGVGLFLLLAPVRFGNIFHDSFGLLPQMSRNDHGKKMILRLIGVAVLAFAIRFALGAFALIREG